MTKILVIPDEGPTSLYTDDGVMSPAMYDTLLALVAAWGEEQLKRSLFRAGIECLDGGGGIRPITKVVPPMLNVEKAWYEYWTTYDPDDPHAHYAADWNLESLGDTDLDEPVVSPFDGIVINREDHGGAWGRIVRVLGYKDGDPVVWMGSHLNGFSDVKLGDVVTPGMVVGRIGKGPNGMYSAHLHEQISVGLVTAATDFRKGPPFVFPPEWYKENGVDPDLVDRLVEMDDA